MPYFYQSGEQIKARDRVRFHGELGEVKFVADPVEDSSNWYVQEYGGGVMIFEPKVFGRLFVQAPVSQYHDLEFVARRS